jgi:NTE family protein
MDMQKSLPDDAHTLTRKNRIVLVLQGGGALGAYQAGVYQALHEHDLAPDWIVGTSIGAINAALIAGNTHAERLARLKTFWDRVSHGDIGDLRRLPDETRRINSMLVAADVMWRGVPGFFRPRLPNPFAAGLPVGADVASFYDTNELAGTLRELVDFDYLNAIGGARLTVNAVRVGCGELVCFDSRQAPITVEHIMASGALPPGFPPVRIDGELYWDGGLYSNTPLETVLDDTPAVDTLCFMVDLWNPEAHEPTTLDEVQTRQKDVMFASRSKRHIEDYLHVHSLQRKLRLLYEKLPEDARAGIDMPELSQLGCNTTMHIVRLPYPGQDWHMASKDINFSKGSVAWRWERGYLDATRGIRQAGWKARVADGIGIVLHELLEEEGRKHAAR